MALASGTRVGAYEIIAPLGGGAMGEVYRARDHRLGRDVALKVLPERYVSDPDRRSRFEREARLLGALNHPHIAAIYGFEDAPAVTGGRVGALVLELVEGETLAERIAAGDGGLPVGEVVAVARQLVEALDAAHERGIIHRDLKPANIMLTPDGVVKVLDFGLARAIGENSSDAFRDAATLAAGGTQEGVILGTASYMSPEQARGRPADKRTDIWAFGCVIYESLAGRQAFPGETLSDVIAGVLEREPDWTALPGTTPAGLGRLLRRCLEKDPRRRLRDIGDAEITLDEVDEEPAPTGPGRTWTRRRRVAAAGLAAIAVLAAGVGAGVRLERSLETASSPSYERLTFRRGLIRTARIAPDGQTIFYAAAWGGGPSRVYTVRPESPESRAIELPEATVLAISSKGELALALGSHLEGVITYGTLARVPLAGGVPRELLEDVKFADWSPDGTELAIVRRVAGTDRLEFPVGRVLVTSSGSGAGGLAFPRISPDGRRVAFIEYVGGLHGRVAVVDRTGGKTTLSRDYVNIFGLAWRGDEIWFTASDDQPLFRALHAVRPGATPRVLARVPGNATLHDVAADGSVVIAQTDDRQGFAVLRPGDSHERDLSWLDAAQIADLSPDGQWALFTEFGHGGGPDRSVYLRRTDGSPAVRLGAGWALALSPDAKWALAAAPLLPSRYLTVIPTGPGETRRIEGQGLAYWGARWLPDGRVVARAQETGHAAKLYLLDLAGGPPRALTPEGVESWAVSPDGSMVATGGEDSVITFYGIDEAGMVSRSNSRGRLAGWTEQGLLLTRGSASRHSLNPILRIDPATHREEPWKEIVPSDPAGIMYFANFQVTPDGRSYGYSWHRALSDLYLVKGLE